MFDPYYKWLGIPPKDQPPNHYRLLSVDVFERDLDVIEGAADRLMGFVRQYQSGEHAAEAARILNELATARMCLLKPAKKAEYDAQLRRKQSPAEPESGFPGIDFSVEQNLEKASLVRTRSKVSKSSKSASGTSARLLMVGGGIAATCLTIVVFVMSRQTRPPVPKTTETTDVAVANPVNVKPDIPVVKTTAPVIVPPNPLLSKEPKLVTEPVEPTGPFEPLEPAGTPIDLLKLVELPRDVVSGDWQQAKTALIGSSGSKIYLPSKTTDDYQLNLTVRRLEKADALSIGFMMAGRQGVLSLDTAGATVSGLFLDGHDPGRNCTIRRGKQFQGQSIATVDMTVHPDHFRTTLNGQTIVDWYGDPRRLFVPENVAVSCRETPFIAIADAKYVIESAVLIPLRPETVHSRIARLEREIDVIALIDVERDAHRGIWAQFKNTLSSPEGFGTISLPTEVPEEYTLSAQVELPAQHQGDYNLVFGAIAGRSYFQLTTTVGHTGIDMIDGVRWNANETVVSGARLKPGVASQIECTVSKDAIRMEIDGKTLIDWNGDIRRLSIPNDWSLPDARRLFIGSTSHVKLRNIKLGPPIPAPTLPDHPPVSIGKPIDLLAIIDPARDAFGGTWDRDGRAVLCKGDIDFNKLSVPFEVPNEYELKVKVARTETGSRQNEVLYLGLPAEQSKLLVMIDAGGSTANGVQIDDAINFSKGGGPMIPPKVTREIGFVVRKNGLKITNDGKTVVDWKGNSDRFQVLPNCVVPGRRISLGSWNQGFRFEKLELTPIPPTGFPDVGPVPVNGKLLSIINADRDARAGTWQLKEGGLLGTAVASLSRLRVPANVPQRYVFTVTVERQQGNEDLLIGLPVGDQVCTLGIDALGGHQAGLDELDQKRFVDKSNLSNRIYTQQLLPQNQKIPLRCVVLPDSIIVFCGGKEVVRWHGDSRRLAPNQGHAPANVCEADRSHIWLGSWKSGFLFRDLDLKPLSDAEAEEISKSFSGVFPTTPQSNVPFATSTSPPAKPTVESSSDQGDKHWLLPRKPDARALIIVLSDQSIEWDAAIEACRYSRLPFQIVPSFPPPEFDYSQFSLIVVGTNAMDEWGQPERKDPASFRSIEAFAKAGGHLVVFNTFNGRNLEHLRQFGIQSSTQHATTYQAIPRVTEILFDGSERLVPEGSYLRQAGNYTVDQPHLDLLRRGAEMGEGAVVSTIPYGAGRVTYSSVEPGFGEPPGYWLVQIMIRWAARGAPVSKADLQELARQSAADQSRQAASKQTKLTILDAKFGVDGKLIDITAGITATAKSGLLLVTSDSSLVDSVSGGDKPKFLHLRYRLNGLEEFQKVAENYAIQLDARPPSSAKFSKDFKLIDARWGTGAFTVKTRDSWVNVTEQIKPFVKKNGLKLTQEESIAAMSPIPDPRPGVAKTLLIQFQYQGKEEFAQYPNLAQPVILGAVEP